MSIQVNPKTGAIARLYNRNTSDLPLPLSSRDIDLRGKVVFPGFVDSHTHIFLHSDKCVPPPTSLVTCPPSTN
jgi:imidazolonepropionase-like amidohydrolase